MFAFSVCQSVTKLVIVFVWLWVWTTVAQLQYKVLGDLPAHVHRNAINSVQQRPVYGCGDCSMTNQVYVCTGCAFTNTTATASASASVYQHAVHADALISRHMTKDNPVLAYTELGERLMFFLVQDAVSYPSRTPWLHVVNMVSSIFFFCVFFAHEFRCLYGVMPIVSLHFTPREVQPQIVYRDSYTKTAQLSLMDMANADGNPQEVESNASSMLRDRKTLASSFSSSVATGYTQQPIDNGRYRLDQYNQQRQ